MSDKMKYLIILFFSLNTQASQSTSQFTVSGNVPVVVKADITPTSNPLIYLIHEISNNPNGYVIILHTDTTDNGMIISNILSQDKSIDNTKELKLTSLASYVSITVTAN
jgi:hypothetical protein